MDYPVKKFEFIFYQIFNVEIRIKTIRNIKELAYQINIYNS